MKKIFVGLLIALVICGMMSSCGGNDVNSSENDESASQGTQTSSADVDNYVNFDDIYGEQANGDDKDENNSTSGDIWTKLY